MSQAAKAQEAITAIKENPVAVFSKAGCPYCLRAKARLNKFLGENKYYVLDLDTDLKDRSEMSDFQDALNNAELFGEEALKPHGLVAKRPQRSVPNIWINKTQIGGCDDFFSYSDDKVKSLLEEAGAKLV